MSKIQPAQLPSGVLLTGYQNDGHYTDCFSMELDQLVSLQQFVEAFYTTPLFKLERLLLRLFVSRPSSDAQAAQIAAGEVDRFAAWSVEQRSSDELLMCDMSGNTRSWFKVESWQNGAETRTRLYFGSAVVHRRDEKTGEYRIGTIFRLLLGFHRVYSVALLSSARRKLLAAR